jgi:tetratricopeptide (TPR) repeat protein
MLAVVEVSLRTAGYGHPASFFVPATVEGRKVLVENGQFGLRFFPADMARRPAPTVVEFKKPAGTVRIFLFGESAALGDPNPAYGMGRYLEVLLNERFGGTRFEVVCVAMTAINSHVMVPLARECARREGDIWVIYMGHNEMTGPFGATAVLGPQVPPRTAVRAMLALRATRTGQWLTRTIQSLRGDSTRSPSWGGMRMFLEHQVAPTAPKRALVHRHFAANLDEIIRIGSRAGVRMILSTAASNLKDCAPFASQLGDQTIGSLEKDWEGLVRLGEQRQREGAWAEALAAYAAAAAIDPQHAELAFREGTCRWKLGELASAREKFAAARDLDALPFRADTTINGAIKQTGEAWRSRGVRLVDAEAVLSEIEGIAGQASFYEHVHLMPAANYRMARVFGAEIETLLPESIRLRGLSEWATPETCARRLGLTDWNREALWTELLARLGQPPFTNQLGYEERLVQYHNEQRAVRTRLNAEAAAAALELYEDAIRRSPADHRLRANFAEYLAAVGRLDEAVSQWRRVEALLPHHHVAPFFIGKLRSRQGAYEEARIWLERCLEREPGAVDAMVELGRLEARRKQPVAAMAHYRAALARQPWSASLHLDLAEVQAASGDRDAAIESLRQAIALRPSLWLAHYYLGVELAERDQIPEAAAAFAEVVRLNPDFALAHLNLGVAQIRLGQIAEATERFRVTLELDPANEKARRYLEQLKTLQSGSTPEVE